MRVCVGYSFRVYASPTLAASPMNCILGSEHDKNRDLITAARERYEGQGMAEVVGTAIGIFVSRYSPGDC